MKNQGLQELPIHFEISMVFEKLKFTCFTETIFCLIIHKFEHSSDIFKKLLCKSTGTHFLCLIFSASYRLHMCNKDIIGLRWIWASDFLVDADYCFQFQTIPSQIKFHFFYRLVNFLPFLDLNCINMVQIYYEIH